MAKKMNIEAELKVVKAKADELAADLREPLTGNDREHQAKKADIIAEKLERIVTYVHGSGTGTQKPKKA